MHCRFGLEVGLLTHSALSKYISPASSLAIPVLLLTETGFIQGWHVEVTCAYSRNTYRTSFPQKLVSFRVGTWRSRARTHIILTEHTCIYVEEAAAMAPGAALS